MTEWWTYRPSDFLMFAPRTWWRLFELHNTAWWPLPPLCVAAGLAWLVWALRRGDAAWRVGAAGLALACAFVGAAFMLPRYAPINWAANGFAVGWFMLAALLAALVFTPARPAAPFGPRRATGALLCGWAVVGHPLLAPAFGRPWAQAEVLGMAPDPTALAVLGLLWLLPGGDGTAARLLRQGATALALSWCVITVATLATMGSGEAAVMGAGTVLAGVGAWAERWRQRPAARGGGATRG